MKSNRNLILELISKTLKIEEEKLNCKSCFTTDFSADSLDIVELVVEIEKSFNITIPDEDIEQFITVENTINYVQQRI
jgi:acyl carrier protein